MDGDPDDLQRFVEAQAAVFESVRRELAEGRKRSHWMWFVFPQLRGLGRSAMAQHYGLASIDEARAYAAHSLLGARLLDCAALVLNAKAASAYAMFGSPDDLKLHSCMTLFAQAAPLAPVFEQVLRRFFEGRPDARTLALLGGSP